MGVSGIATRVGLLEKGTLEQRLEGDKGRSYAEVGQASVGRVEWVGEEEKTRR